MAIEKVGVYPKWLGPIPKDKNRKPLPKSQWLKRRRHRWVTRWYSSDQKMRYGKVFETRREAENYAAEMQRQVCCAKADKPENITLHAFLLEHSRVMKGQLADATVQDQNRALRFFENFIGGSIKLSKIRPRDAEAFIAYRLSTVLSAATVNKDIRTLKRIFSLAIEPRGYLQEGHNPFAKIKERKLTEGEIRYVEAHEYRCLMEEAENLWWRALLSAGYGSGLRRNEILHLTWKDIDFEGQMIKVVAKKKTSKTIAWEPKNHRKRIVPMSDETSQLLASLQLGAEDGYPYIFISPQRFQHITERQKIGQWRSFSQVINNLDKNFRVLRRKAGIESCTIHDLRRSAITNWAKKLPINIVQQLAGHTSIETTRKYYLSVRPEDIASANELLRSVLSKTKSH